MTSSGRWLTGCAAGGAIVAVTVHLETVTDSPLLGRVPDLGRSAVLRTLCGWKIPDFRKAAVRELKLRTGVGAASC